MALHFLIGAVVLWLEGGRAWGSGMGTMGGEVVRGVGRLESEWWRRGGVGVGWCEGRLGAVAEIRMSRWYSLDCGVYGDWDGLGLGLGLWIV